MEIEIVKNRKSATSTITFTGADKPAGIPPQAQYIYYAIAMLEEATLADIGAKAVELGMRTRQDPARIAAYYLPVLRDHGVV